MAPVGFSISDTAVRFVDLRSGHKSLKLKAYAEKEIPPGIVSGGYVHNVEELTKIVRSFREEWGIQFVRAALPEEKAYLFKTEVSLTEGSSLRDAVEFKIEENVPLSVATAVFDYSVINKRKEKNAGHADVIVSVLPIKVVSTYIEVLEGAGLIPISFQVESQAIARSVIKKGDKSTYLVVNLGTEKTGLYVVSDETVHFASSFVFSEGSVKKGIESSDSFTLKVSKTTDASCDEIWMTEVASEISKLFSYWHTHEDKEGELGKQISKVFICGDHPNIQSCLGPVSNSVSVPVAIANVWTNAFSFDDFVPDMPRVHSKESKDSSLKYAAAIGLALPEYYV
jgi:Tfp pilus assembly PilM family ATPase